MPGLNGTPNQTLTTEPQGSCAGSPAGEPLPFAARHYSVSEIAAMWSLSPDYIRRLFEREPDVLVLGDTRPPHHKRRYITLRVPA